MADARHRLPLLGARASDAPLAWRAGRPIAARTFLAAAQALAARLPAAGPAVNLCQDRVAFALGLAAALQRGHTSLMPPNALPQTLERLAELGAAPYALVDDEKTDTANLQRVVVPPIGAAADATGAPAVPEVDGTLEAVCLLTSGSTGTPQPHVKRWGPLVANIGAEAERLAEHLGRASLEGLTIVATVPPQHSYGFESSVLLALLGGAALEAGRPFYPADIVAALEAVPRPRALVTTPFHLKTLLRSGLALPAVELVLSATAPLSPQLAAEAERALGGPLVEIYGCTEAGQVASRRTTEGETWRALGALRLWRDASPAADGTPHERFLVEGGHVTEPTPLADVLEIVDAQQFRLLGRSGDLIHVAGKRSSLAHLNFQLNRIEGVEDGAFWLPDDVADGVVRPVAFVVAPTLDAAAIVAALRRTLEAAFVPRRVVLLDALPREATGKLTAATLRALAAQHAGATPAPARADTIGAPAPVAAPAAGAAEAAATQRVEWTVPAEHPAFAGHFPGQPVLPGVALVAQVLEAISERPALAARLGERPVLEAVKFLHPVGPGARLATVLQPSDAGVAFEVLQAARPVARGKLRAAHD